MLRTARGGLPNSSIPARRSGWADSVPAPPTRSVSSMPGTNEDKLQETRALHDVAKAVDPVVAGAVRHQQAPGSGHPHEARVAAARGGIDAAIRARGGEHAKRRHRDELLGITIDLWPRLRDDARRGLRVNRGEINGHGRAPKKGSAHTIIVCTARPRWLASASPDAVLPGRIEKELVAPRERDQCERA